MMRNSRRKDSKREENSPTERFSEIIFFEPALKAVDEKSYRKSALQAESELILGEHFKPLRSRLIWVVPRKTFVPFLG